MKSRVLSLLQVALFAALPPAVGTAFSQTYTVTNLGTPLGGSFALAGGIGSGSYGGYANLANNTTQHAVLWNSKTNAATDLGTLGGSNSTLLNQFDGFSETASKDSLGQDFCGTGTHLVCLPITAQSGTVQTLPLLGGQNGSAFGNNIYGIVVGSSQPVVRDAGCLVGGNPVAPFYQAQQSVPVEWIDNHAFALPTYPGDADGTANAINDLNQVVGASGDCVQAPTAHGLIWNGATPTNLGNLGGSLGTNPFAINDFSQVTGTSDVAGDLTSHAFLWQNGVMKDLGTLPGDYYSVGYAINDLGQIVGQSCDANRNCRAFLWQNGTMTDLNTRIAAGGALYLYLAAAIDDLGVITGYAVDKSSNTQPAFALTPRLSLVAHEHSAPRVSLPPDAPAQVKPNLRTLRGSRQALPPQ